jgi:hypothetical protein
VVLRQVKSYDSWFHPCKGNTILLITQIFVVLSVYLCAGGASFWTIHLDVCVESGKFAWYD